MSDLQILELTVECPFCGACPGARCHVKHSDGKVDFCTAHTERYLVAKEGAAKDYDPSWLVPDGAGRAFISAFRVLQEA